MVVTLLCNALMYYECTHLSCLCFLCIPLWRYLNICRRTTFGQYHCSALIEPFIARGGQADKAYSLPPTVYLRAECAMAKEEDPLARPASNWRPECSDEDCVCPRISKMCLLCKYLFAHYICLQRRRVSFSFSLRSRWDRKLFQQ